MDRVSWGLPAGQEGAPCERADLPLIAFDLLVSRLLAAKAHCKRCHLRKPLDKKSELRVVGSVIMYFVEGSYHCLS